MFNYIVNHALQNTWCNPEQDNQHILAIHRLTEKHGVVNNFRLMLRNMALPTSNFKYHVYQIGQLQPTLLRMLSINPTWVNERWIKISDIMVSENIIIDLYNETGLHVPRFEAYYMFTNERDLIVAIKDNPKVLINYTSDNLFMRLYRNAYFDSDAANGITDKILTGGMIFSNGEEILTLQAAYRQIQLLPGKVLAFKNGLLVDEINLLNFTVGDVAEYVYDSSVYKTIKLKLSELPVFLSKLDDKNKYLLHSSDIDNNTIYYYDDNDIYLTAEISGNRYRGVYYHNNAVDSCRMVTHRDYSIPVSYISYMVDGLSDYISSTPIDINDVSVVITIRHSGYQRPLVQDNSRIFELYSLSDDLILNALTGLNSTLDIWKAENLENSGYAKLMRVNSYEITQDLIQRAYGYNAIAKLAADTPKRVYLSSGVKVIDLPFGLRNNSTGYEYDIDGRLLGYYKHIAGDRYVCHDSATTSVEVLTGIGDHTPDVRFGLDNISVPMFSNYRVYKNSNLPENVWEDITGTDAYYIEDNVLKYIVGDFNYLLMVRTDIKFIAYDLELASIDGVVDFVLSEMENRGNGVAHHTLPVPTGTIDIFMNGRLLVNGLDYIVNFPKVTIINKEYLLQPSDTLLQHVHVRLTGFCNKQLEFEQNATSGYIVHGLLLNNNKYDITKDKIMHISVDGKLKHVDEVTINELHNGVGIFDVTNGRPYQVKNTIVPLGGILNMDSYEFRELSVTIDNKVSDYMTVKSPSPVISELSVIPQRYVTYSPFISKLIHVLHNGILDHLITDANFNNTEIIDICKPYESFLLNDPTQPQYQPDSNYVIIHPHNLNTVIDLNLFQYRFLSRVVNLYCNGLIELSPFVSLKQFA